ncbi:secreted protein [Phakopsora pachyrhizi]|uniref:Secreted protein n=1 Tax=Phakopsora pachyrhizi TaxID=170000 RepID=A0A0S1MJP6_PHAPC|nr:secreted protein [Phakopsora pachyrhizi]
MYKYFKSSIVVFAFLFLSMVVENARMQRLEVKINDPNDFCLVVPKDANTRIGDSEYPGGETVWCQGPKSIGATGTFNGKFWSNVEVSRPKNGVIQMTGCINVDSCDRLRKDDGGGQYDSNGGEGGRGNPANSFCSPYPVYVELIEPSARRACIRCCQNAADCDVTKDTSGCPAVIPGNYFGCA